MKLFKDMLPYVDDKEKSTKIFNLFESVCKNEKIYSLDKERFLFKTLGMFNNQGFEENIEKIIDTIIRTDSFESYYCKNILEEISLLDCEYLNNHYDKFVEKIFLQDTEKCKDMRMDIYFSQFILENGKNRNNIEQCLIYLEKFLTEININDLENIILEKNIEKLEKLTEIENIEIDLVLGKIYYKILSSENFFTDYFSDHDENETKISLVLSLIEGAIGIIENFEDDIITKENFELKRNIMRLIKFMKINLKEALEKDEIKQLDSYINDLPNHFYCKNY